MPTSADGPQAHQAHARCPVHHQALASRRKRRMLRTAWRMRWVHAAQGVQGQGEQIDRVLAVARLQEAET